MFISSVQGDDDAARGGRRPFVFVCLAECDDCDGPLFCPLHFKIKVLKRGNEHRRFMCSFFSTSQSR